MLFIEKILNTPTLLNPQLQDSLTKATVLKIQNIADYFYMGTDQEVWNNTDFPNVAPTLPIMWFEWKHPAYSNSNGTILSVDNTCANMMRGVLLLSQDLKNEDDFSDPYLHEIKRMKETNPDDLTRWYCQGYVFMEIENHIVLAGVHGFAVNEDGSLTGSGLYWPGPGIKHEEWNDADKDDLRKILSSMMHIPFLALSFSHCKNVTLSSNTPSAKQQKARQKRGHAPKVVTYTLVIEAIKGIIKNAVGGTGNLSAKALHICRGHFKDFTTNGLFGKLKGVFWWPMHTRGDIANGKVNKDYEVKSPPPSFPNEKAN